MFEDFLLDNVFEDKKLTKSAEVIKLKEGERRNVSVLFADVKGFTALSETLDSEQVQNLLDTLLKAFTYCINKYGGYVDKYEGDLVMALFGAKKASERDTKRAIYCGLEMLEQLKKFNAYLLAKPQFKDKFIDLGVRIGINTGLVVTGKVGEEREGDFTVYGDAVNVASRMESNAPINSIMIPEETMMLVENDFFFESRGEIAVKGKVNPINVYLVRGKNESYGIESYKTKFIGRDKELSQVINFYNQGILKLLSRQENEVIKPIIIGVKGVAGIGKTRFLNQFIQNRLYDEGDHIIFLQGAATNLSQITYYLFIDVIKKYLQVLSFETTEQTKNKLEIVIRNLSKFAVDEQEKNDLLESIPILGFLLGIKYNDNRLNLKGQDLQLHIQHAIKTFIFVLAKKINKQGYPLVIILEDLQWNDQNSNDFLHFLFRTISLIDVSDKNKVIQILFIFTSRTDYQLSEEIQKLSNVEELELKSLSNDDSLSLIRFLLGRIEIPENIKYLLLEKSEGNPFYIEEWIAMINNDNFIDFKRKKFLKDVEIPIPGNLNALILSRIDQLQGYNKLLLQKASVIGRKFNTGVLSQMENRIGGSAEVSTGIKYLSENDFIQAVDDNQQYQFKHILIQEVSYNTLLESNKKLLHKIIGEVLEESYSANLQQHYYDLAFHFDRSDDNKKATHYLFEAGNKAADEYANNEAIEFLGKLIKRLDLANDTSNLKMDSLVRYADIMQFISNYKVAEAKYFDAEKLAIDQDNQKQLAHIYTRVGWNYALLGDKDLFEVYTYKAISLLKDIADEIGLAKAIGNLAVVKINSFDEKLGIQYLTEQLEIFKRHDYKKETTIALLNLGLAKCRIGELDESMRDYNEALAIAQQIKDRKRKSILLGNIAGVHVLKKEYDKAIEQFKLAVKEAQDIGFKESLPRTYYTMAFCYYEMEDYQEAEKYAVKCNELVEGINQQDITTEAIIMLSKIRFAMTQDPKIIHYLRILLKTTETPYELACLNTEIWKMASKLSYTTIDAEAHRKKALELFKDLYSKSPVSAFKENIEKLENNN